MSQNSTTRFSNRVQDYIRSRPGYPPDLVRALESAGLSPRSIVADIGAGTGISTEMFLQLGCIVFAVEPNAAMRQAAIDRFGGMAGFRAVDGTAEHTTLGDATVDLVTAGQAFHWFDRGSARAEFARILRPGGQVALFWNDRRREETPLLRDYERLLQTYSTDYNEVDHRRMNDAVLGEFFGGPYESRRFINVQVLDYEGFVGRLLSSSYTPGPDDPRRAPMLTELSRIFDANEQGGQVELIYDTLLSYGPVTLGP